MKNKKNRDKLKLFVNVVISGVDGAVVIVVVTVVIVVVDDVVVVVVYGVVIVVGIMYCFQFDLPRKKV